MKRQWYFEVAGTQAGPIDESEAAAKIAGGALGPDTLVWTNGQKNWMTAKETELAVYLTLPRSAELAKPVVGTRQAGVLPSSTPAPAGPSAGSAREAANAGPSIRAVAASAARAGAASTSTTPTGREEERNQNKGNGALFLGLGLLGILISIVVGAASYAIGLNVGRSNGQVLSDAASRLPPVSSTRPFPEPTSLLQWPIVRPDGDWQANVDLVGGLWRRGDLRLDLARVYPYSTQSDAETAFANAPLQKLIAADAVLENNWVWWIDRFQDAAGAYEASLDFYLLVQNPTAENIRAITIAMFDSDCKGSAEQMSAGTADQYYNLIFVNDTIKARSGAFFVSQLAMMDHLPKTQGDRFCMVIIGAYGDKEPKGSAQKP